ncbi:hypothetical protein ACP8HI_12420 [Paenibacillus sp. FA6]|uniref:hypothetical protein n=1 Tax=Paenibacillus sp. FA6 TaxID=3413029 RepID=UPI003F65700E
MKKVFLVLLVIFIVSGCGSSTTNINNESETNTTNSPSTAVNTVEKLEEVEAQQIQEQPVIPETIVAHDFREVDWGMSSAEVKKVESTIFESEKDSKLTFRTDIYDLNASLIYVFNPYDQLITSKYEFPLNNSSEYIKELRTLKQGLVDKYGDASDITEWFLDDFRNDEDLWSKAIDNHDVVFQYNWKTESTLITLALFNSTRRNEILMYIEYTGTKFKGTTITGSNGL